MDRLRIYQERQRPAGKVEGDENEWDVDWKRRLCTVVRRWGPMGRFCRYLAQSREAVRGAVYQNILNHDLLPRHLAEEKEGIAATRK